MRNAIVVAAMLGGMAALGSVTAAQKPSMPRWVGTWEYVAAPLPPGETPPAIPLFAPPPLTPLDEPGAAAAPAPALAFPPPRIDNPGNVPLGNANADLNNVTLREVIRTSVGGERLRLRFSNEAGTEPLVLGSVHVAEAGADGAIVPGSDHPVQFAGHAGVILPPGAPVLSDAVELATRPLEKLYVSVYLPRTLAARAQRSLFEYVAGQPGDFTGADSLPQVHLMRVPSLLTLLEVQTSRPASVVVALGDSITEGATSTANAFRSWPDRLAERLASHDWAVANAGISGNRLLRYGTGPSALARLDRDVLSVPGVRAIILMEGINDIGRGSMPVGPSDPFTVTALEAADLQIIARAHEHGIRVIGATLTPYQGAAYASPAGESAREALNSWIRSSGVFDGVIDFAPVVAAPDNPLTFAPGYNDRDHLHPNDAGYKAMADAIDLGLVTGDKGKSRR
ncbi:MAG TPA: SGNH/GDSL hydrolase family protein [Steroidobacteraceae bacterium]|nr:SGNH/GDSL hydrolase family protein [Steroidobacteraceae bacterium]